MQEKIDRIRQLIETPITESSQQDEALGLLDEIEQYTENTISGYEFIQRASFELRTPLSSIIGYSELLMRKDLTGELDDKQYDYIQRINKAGKYLSEFINELLDIARAETKAIQAKLNKPKSQDEVLSLLGEIEQDTETTISGYKVIQKLSNESNEQLGYIIVDAERLLRKEWGELNDEQNRRVQYIHKTGKTFLKLIQETVTFAKIKTGSIKLHPKIISIQDFLEERRVSFQKTAEYNQCLLTVNTGLMDARVLVDSWQFHCILRDVIAACGGYKEPKVELTPQVIIVNDKKWLEINILSHGHGIDIAAWQKFYQTGRVYRQLGWHGLVIPYELCQLMGGTLEVFRESDTSVRYGVRFPVVEE